jgi:phosphatidylinositol glycan class O
MENEEIFTPASEITAPSREKDVKSAPPSRRSAGTIDEDKAKRAGQVHFKAAHGLIVAFFTLILYVPICVRLTLLDFLRAR